MIQHNNNIIINSIFHYLNNPTHLYVKQKNKNVVINYIFPYPQEPRLRLTTDSIAEHDLLSESHPSLPHHRSPTHLSPTTLSPDHSHHNNICHHHHSPSSSFRHHQHHRRQHSQSFSVPSSPSNKQSHHQLLSNANIISINGDGGGDGDEVVSTTATPGTPFGSPPDIITTSHHDLLGSSSHQNLDGDDNSGEDHHHHNQQHRLSTTSHHHHQHHSDRNKARRSSSARSSSPRVLKTSSGSSTHNQNRRHSYVPRSTSATSSYAYRAFPTSPLPFYVSGPQTDVSDELLTDSETECFQMLDHWGISKTALSEASPLGVRSAIIGSYRILLHRILNRGLDGEEDSNADATVSSSSAANTEQTSDKFEDRNAMGRKSLGHSSSHLRNKLRLVSSAYGDSNNRSRTCVIV